MDGKAVVNIFSDIQPIPISKKAFDTSGLRISFYPPSEKGTMYQDYIIAIQMGKNKKCKKYPCAFNMNGESVMREYQYFPKYLFCDLDGDKQSELVAYHDGSGSLQQRIVVYRLSNGALEKSFSVTP